MLTRAPLVGVFLAGLLTGFWADASQAAGPAAPSPEVQGADLLVVSEDDPWSMALAAPVVARLRQSGVAPLVVAISNPPTHEADWLIGLASPRRPVVLAPDGPMRLGHALEQFSPEILAIGSKGVEASLCVARRFWKQPREAVLATADDPEALILGSALAAGRAAPLLIRRRADTGQAVAEALATLGVQRAWIAVGHPDEAPAWAASPPFHGTLLGPHELQHELVAALGAEAVRNVVVARLPEPHSGAGKTAWLAPVLSVARGAPVVLAHAASPAVAEADAAELIRREGLRPRTITVLADYASISQHVLEIEIEPAARGAGPSAATGPAAAVPAVADQAPPAAPPVQEAAAPPAATHYTVNTEPFIPGDFDKVVPMGVGRIPLESAADASVLFARGLLRERMLATAQPRLLMVANAGSMNKPLPLCETISRVTAEEFKNFGVHVDDFYGKLADSPEIMTVAKTANVIIYEGHLGYQDLIDVPFARRTTTPDTYFEEELDQLEGGEAEPEQEPPREPAPAARPGTMPGRVVAVPAASRLVGPLGGLPIVILQSCDSLEEPLLWRVDELGGVAVIGSMTPIHSASGSALVHAAASAVLYGGDTLGEALRDAQNYLFCLEDLKGRRGHKEQAKGRRVAVSFRLWGDPELRFFPARVGRPALPPVVARWTGPDTLTVRIPTHRLAEARSSKYFARMFPGSQAAGMVKGVEGDPNRRLTPVYFFRVRLPADWTSDGPESLAPSGADAKRMSLRVDPLGRLLYVVYYPEVERAGESIVLRLERPRRDGAVGRAVP